MRARHLPLPAVAATATVAALTAVAMLPVASDAAPHRSAAASPVRTVVYAAGSAVYRAKSDNVAHATKLIAAPPGYEIDSVKVSPSHTLMAAVLISDRTTDGDPVSSRIDVSPLAKPHWRTVITTEGDATSNGVTGLAWASTSRTLYYSRLYDIGIKSRLWVWSVKAKGTPHPAKLTGTNGMSRPAVSPDGKTIVADAGQALVSYRLRTHKKATLDTSKGGFGDIAFSPSGKTLVYETYFGDNSDSEGSYLAELRLGVKGATSHMIAGVTSAGRTVYYVQPVWLTGSVVWFARYNDGDGRESLASITQSAAKPGTWSKPVAVTTKSGFSPSVA